MHVGEAAFTDGDLLNDILAGEQLPRGVNAVSLFVPFDAADLFAADPLAGD